METISVEKTGPAVEQRSGVRPRPDSRTRKVLLAGRPGTAPPFAEPEQQMFCLFRSLPALGVSVRLWRPWEDTLADFDCLHLFGSASEHLGIVEAARRERLRVVVSPVLWHAPPARASQHKPIGWRVAALAEQVRRSVWPVWTAWRQELYQAADLLLPNSNAEAQELIKQLQVPAEKIHIVPHAADPHFAAASPAPFIELYGVRDFVLVAGAIEPRNHQLSFLWALREMDVPVVVLGDAAAGNEWYLEECRRAAGERVRFVPQMDHDEQLRASACAACACMAAGGGFETSARAALEAGMSGTPLVLPEGSYATEYFGQQAIYVRPEDLAGIRRALRLAIGRGRSRQLAEHVRSYYSWNAAGKAIRRAYERLMAKRGPGQQGR